MKKKVVFVLLGCTLAMTSSSFSVYIWVKRLSKNPFTPGLCFPKYPKFHWEILFQLNFVYNRTSGGFICVCFKICQLSGVLAVAWL